MGFVLILAVPLYVTNTLDDPYVEQTQIAATYALQRRPVARIRTVAVRCSVSRAWRSRASAW